VLLFDKPLIYRGTVSKFYQFTIISYGIIWAENNHDGKGGAIFTLSLTTGK
jgi:hypothetical protein